MTKHGIVKVEPSLHKQIKVASALSGKTISQIINQALVEWLERHLQPNQQEAINAG